MSKDIFDQIADGYTDLVFDYVGAGHAVTSTDKDGVSLLQWCSYHGDVSAIKFLLAHGESLQSLGHYYGLNAAAFHGHWRLCKYLIEQAIGWNGSLHARLQNQGGNAPAPRGGLRRGNNHPDASGGGCAH